MKASNKFLKPDMVHKGRYTGNMDDEYKNIYELDEEFRAYINDNPELKDLIITQYKYIGGGGDDDVGDGGNTDTKQSQNQNTKPSIELKYNNLSAGGKRDAHYRLAETNFHYKTLCS